MTYLQVRNPPHLLHHHHSVLAVMLQLQYSFKVPVTWQELEADCLMLHAPALLACSCGSCVSGKTRVVPSGVEHVHALDVCYAVCHCLQDIFNLLPNMNVEALSTSLAVKGNDMMAVIYLASLIRSVLALHKLIDNKEQRMWAVSDTLCWLLHPQSFAEWFCACAWPCLTCCVWSCGWTSLLMWLVTVRGVDGVTAELLNLLCWVLQEKERADKAKAAAEKAKAKEKEKAESKEGEAKDTDKDKDTPKSNGNA